MAQAARTNATTAPPAPAVDRAPARRAGLLWGRAQQLVTRAGRKSFWPLVDQGVVSAGNFLTLVIVARALPAKSEYGVFGLLLEAIFYLNTLQGALVTYPLTVKGATADKDGLKRLATAALLMTLAVALPVALCATATAALARHATLGLAGAFALVAWQAQEVARKALLAHFRYADAAWGDALRYLGTAACAWLAWRHGALTLPRVFWIIGALAALATLVQAAQVGLRAVGWRDLVRLAREFAAAGRWLLLTSLSALLVSLCGVWALGVFHGTGVVGQFYAVANFTKPVNPVVMTFGGLVLQHAARAYADGGAGAARRIAYKLSAIMLALTLPYLLVLMLAPGPAMRLFYGAGSHFRDPAGELALRLFILGFFPFLCMTLIGSFLNGIGRTRDSFVAQIVNGAATVAIALPMTIRWGLIGMVAGGTIAAFVQLAAMVHLVRKAT